MQTSQASVNYVNNVVTGRAPNTYSPYDSHGNVYSYYNSSYDTGKIPSPDAPRIRDVDADSIHDCESSPKETKPALTQTKFDAVIHSLLDGLLGAGNSAGRNILDLSSGIAKLITPQKAYYIDSRADDLKEKLESSTRGLAMFDSSYDAELLIGDVATVIAEYAGLIKAAKGIGTAVQTIPKVISSLGSLLPAGAPLLEAAIPVAGTAVEAGAAAGALALLGDVLLNASAFKEDWNTLVEDTKSETTESNNTINEEKAGSNRLLSKKEISDLGGEKTTSILKETYGGSKSDLRVDSAGNVYVVRKGNMYGELLAHWKN